MLLLVLLRSLEVSPVSNGKPANEGWRDQMLSLELSIK